MADATITIAANGTPSPDPATLTFDSGDTVTFVADGADVVLCTAPPNFFGGVRHEIPDGESIDLTVSPSASGSFEYVIKTGDLDAKCKGGRGPGTDDPAASGGGGGT